MQPSYTDNRMCFVNQIVLHCNVLAELVFCVDMRVIDALQSLGYSLWILWSRTGALHALLLFGWIHCLKAIKLEQAKNIQWANRNNTMYKYFVQNFWRCFITYTLYYLYNITYTLCCASMLCASLIELV